MKWARRGLRIDARLVALVCLVVLVVVGPGCKGKSEIGFEIALPQSAVGDAAWFEIGAFKDASCAALKPMLNDGVPDGAQTRVAFKRTDAQSPRIGELPRAKYAFGAVAKADDCSILAIGCIEADLASEDRVSILMDASAERTGACGVGSACQAARCVPANDNADPSVGAGCSLELLGAGPLANPVGGGGTLVSAPTISTTPSGFVIVYRESDPTGTTARVTVLPIDPAGGALDPVRQLLNDRCANSNEFDGLGLVTNAEEGQIVLARPACGARPGLELLPFETRPEVTILKDAFRTSNSPTATSLTLSPGHVAARRAAGDVVVYTEDGANRIGTVIPGASGGVGRPSGSFGPQVGATGAWVTASDRVLAVLSSGPPVTSTPVADGGAEGGADAGGGGGGGGGDEEIGPTMSLVMVPVDTPLDQFDATQNKPRNPITFEGSWGALASRGTRVIVVSEGGGPGRSASFRTFDLDKTTAGTVDGFSVDGAEKVTTGDVTIEGDRVYFAVLKPGGVALHVYSNATTTPTPMRDVLFSKQPRIAGMETVKDGRVSVAANDKRVAVVWTTAKVLNGNDTTGGYAVFACTQ